MGGGDGKRGELDGETAAMSSKEVQGHVDSGESSRVFVLWSRHRRKPQMSGMYLCMPRLYFPVLKDMREIDVLSI
jgi:hypothetical protein